MTSIGDVQDVPVLAFERQQDWADWPDEHHPMSRAIWLRLAKKPTGLPSLSYVEAVEVACVMVGLTARGRANMIRREQR
jgi:uncharacterized protein YdeI (YjbR/CyaY-like superfamily)